MNKDITNRGTGGPLLAVIGVSSAIAAASCCAIPLLLVTIGIGGAWVGWLTAASAYQSIFLLVAAACLAGGFWLSHRRRLAACDRESCGTPASRRSTAAGLWLGTVILLIAGTAEWWARLLT